MSIPNGTLGLPQLSAKPSAPPTGSVIIYTRSDGVLYLQDAAGSEFAFGSVDFISSLTGDVSGTGPGAAATTVNFVGGLAAAMVASGSALANNATSVGTPSTIVFRDSSGNFSANIITATLNGSSSGFTGALLGDVTGNQNSTVVSFVGGSTAAMVHLAEQAANSATAVNVASTIVKRDASGNFAANIITADLSGNVTGDVTGNLTGNVTGNVSGSSSSFTGSLSGDVTGTQSSTSINSTVVTGKVLTGYAIGTNTPILATDTVLSAFEKLQAQVGSTSGSAITSLTGDVSASGPGSALATVNSVGGSSAANIHSAELAANAATYLNTASTIVSRDASGNFSANIITATLNGSSSGFTGALLGDVTGNQNSTAISATTITGKLLTGFSVGTNTPIVGTDTILSAFEKIQGQLNSEVSSAITNLTGDVVANGPGIVAAAIQPNVVTNTKLAQMAATTIKGNNTGSPANAADLTETQVAGMLSTFFDANGAAATVQTNLNNYIDPTSLQFGWNYQNPHYYTQMIYTGSNVTEIIYWDSPSMVTQIFTKAMTYTSGLVTQVVLTRISDSATLTKNIAYSGSEVSTVTRS
jgi:hypothetical protein